MFYVTVDQIQKACQCCNSSEHFAAVAADSAVRQQSLEGWVGVISYRELLGATDKNNRNYVIWGIETKIIVAQSLRPRNRH